MPRSRAAEWRGSIAVEPGAGPGEQDAGRPRRGGRLGERRPLSATQQARLLARGRPRGFEVRAAQASERWGIFVEELEAR
eukprot:6503050-Alexandrium_andersonii.AAC.1